MGGVEGKNRDKSQRPMILRKIKDKTVSLELVNIQCYSTTYVVPQSIFLDLSLIEILKGCV